MFKNAPDCEDMQETYKDTDSLFGPETARKAYRKSCKHGLSPRQEISVNMIIHLDAVLSDVVDSFKDQLSNNGRTFTERDAGNDTPATAGQEFDIFKANKLHKVGSILQGSSRRLQNLLPIAVVNVLQSCY